MNEMSGNPHMKQLFGDVQIGLDDTKLRKALSKDPDRVINTLTQKGEVEDGVDTRGVIYRLRESMTDLTKKMMQKLVVPQ